MRVNKLRAVLLTVALASLMSGCQSTGSQRYLAQFKSDPAQACYDRATQPYTFVVDAHAHFRPFGGEAVPYSELIGYFQPAGVLFVNVFGIGQMFSAQSGCQRFSLCPKGEIKPTIRNDVINASNALLHPSTDIHLTLSMSFANLSEPQRIVQQMTLLDDEFGPAFTWMGEVNLVKQALFDHSHRATDPAQIDDWAPFMARLRSPDSGRAPMPLSIHADIGSDLEPTRYLFLMENVLSRYPDNPIVWVHMGLSREQTKLDPQQHIAILSRLLDTYPNLILDISWRVLYESYFRHAAIREQYVAFFNRYPKRILTGSDFVAAKGYKLRDYRREVEINSRINQYLSDEAFRNIALGQNYFDLMGLSYRAPEICQ
ncbi:amidohydrolase family protein [Pseudoalteromonas sp. OOF1S-7]|uniref:amidohydrolase family protein n=1 Tax=Pseudoalteromonas sp. OOF1S-7 TaxID=2917757 RepID=UPI001EF496AE|nr:amidohydrolase family protein [Pseudoalteromonas sp. OOF1S-7]MCG7535583.1 amidohydrolase [Pseudoalteromonas sp. OOF1S-7]